MASNAPTLRPLRRHLLLWGLLFASMIWVLITSEIPLLHTGTLYDGYRAQLIRDRVLLVPHALAGVTALLLGPVQFSSRLRARHLKLHRLLGKVYVAAVFIAAPLALAISWHRPLFVATLTQACTWLITTVIAWITARNRHIEIQRQWMARSYATAFTFITTRILDPWPRYFNMSDSKFVVAIILLTFAGILAVDIAFSWCSLRTRPPARQQPQRSV